MSHTLPGTAILPGFADPVFDSQRIFRRILKGLAHPAQVIPLEASINAPRPIYRSTGALCLTLLDLETALWMDGEDNSEVASWLRFHCACPLVASPSGARFALIVRGEEVQPWHQFHPGEDQFPESSATLIIQVAGFTPGRGRSFQGPGIETTRRLEIQGLAEEFWEFWNINHQRYPLGVDVFFLTASALVGLPRTTEVKE